MNRKLLRLQQSKYGRFWTDRFCRYSLAMKGRELEFQVCPQSETNKLIGAMTAEEVGVADWVVKNNKHAGATTDRHLTHKIYICLSEEIKK